VPHARTVAYSSTGKDKYTMSQKGTQMHLFIARSNYCRFTYF